MTATALRELPASRFGSAYSGRPSFTDDAAVDRLVSGHYRGKPDSGEIAAAIDYLDQFDYSARQIAERIGCTVRTVQRRRSRRRKASD